MSKEITTVTVTDSPAPIQITTDKTRIKKVKSILITQPKPEGDKSPYHDLAKKYDFSRSMISMPYKNKEDLVCALTSLSKASIKNRESTHDELDTALLNWFIIQRSKGLPLSGLIMFVK